MSTYRSLLGIIQMMNDQELDSDVVVCLEGGEAKGYYTVSLSYANAEDDWNDANDVLLLDGEPYLHPINSEPNPIFKFVYTDAQQMAKEYPETFYTPSSEDLAKLKAGDKVKVCIDFYGDGGERPWMVVKEIDGEKITATMTGSNPATGLKYYFEKRHLYDIDTEENPNPDLYWNKGEDENPNADTRSTVEPCKCGHHRAFHVYELGVYQNCVDNKCGCMAYQPTNWQQ